jgi:transcriptional regulator with XRE-family HTH domain
MSDIYLTPADVRAARSLVQWSQAQLAAAAEIGVSTIADFENGARTPIPNNVAAIRRALEVQGVAFTPDGPTIFAKVSLHLMTQETITELRFRYAAEGAAAVREILGIFGAEEEDGVEVTGVQTANPEIRAAIDALVLRHGAAAPQLNRLKKMIGSMPDGEHFLILPAGPSSTAERLQLERYLDRLNNPDSEADDDGAFDRFALLLENYDISNPRTDRRTLVGARRELRRCRFCRRTAAEGASFAKAAHVIATALGNDHLKSAEECDDCNAFFGDETEPSLIAMLDLQRVFLGTQGRGKNDGRPKLRFGQDTVAHDGKKVAIRARSMAKDGSGTFTIDLGKAAAPMIPMAAYRALVKMAISVVAEDQLPHLAKTIEWVRYGKRSDLPLPKVASATVFLPPDPSAQIVLYTRRHPDPRLPHIVGEFRLGCYMYVFAVPFSDQDDWDLVGFFDDPSFQDVFRHYVEAAHWMHQDLSRRQKVVMSPRLRFEQRGPTL